MDLRNTPTGAQNSEARYMKRLLTTVSLLLAVGLLVAGIWLARGFCWNFARGFSEDAFRKSKPADAPAARMGAGDSIAVTAGPAGPGRMACRTKSGGTILATGGPAPKGGGTAATTRLARGMEQVSSTEASNGS